MLENILSKIMSYNFNAKMNHYRLTMYFPMRTLCIYGEISIFALVLVTLTVNCKPNILTATITTSFAPDVQILTSAPMGPTSAV